MDMFEKQLSGKKIKRVHLTWVKRALWIFLVAGLFLYLNASPPILAIASSSMEPTLTRGDLIVISRVSPAAIQEGDVIVYKVPLSFQQKYGYPPSICHRVVRIQNTDGELAFRTKGDSTGQDPFLVLPEQVVGKESKSISFLGYLVMFPQSRQGWFFLGGLIVLLIIYWNSSLLLKGIKGFRSSLTGVSASEFAKSQSDLEQKMNLMSDQVAASMNNFSAAMSEYARHIASHTSAIQSLAHVAQHMETVLVKIEESKASNSPPVMNQPAASAGAFNDRPESHPFAPPAQSGKPENRIEKAPGATTVTPELKVAVKRFIQEYCLKHGITSVEVTPDLKSAVWEFVRNYEKQTVPDRSDLGSPAETISTAPPEPSPAPTSVLTGSNS